MGITTETPTQSARFTLNSVDIKKWCVNILIFAGPDLIVFFGALAAKFTTEGAIFAVLVLNLVIDLIKKFLAGHPQE